MNNKTDHDNKILNIIIVIPLKYHSQVQSKKKCSLTQGHIIKRENHQVEFSDYRD